MHSEHRLRAVGGSFRGSPSRVLVATSRDFDLFFAPFPPVRLDRSLRAPLQLAQTVGVPSGIEISRRYKGFLLFRGPFPSECNLTFAFNQSTVYNAVWATK